MKNIFSKLGLSLFFVIFLFVSCDKDLQISQQDGLKLNNAPSVANNNLQQNGIYSMDSREVNKHFLFYKNYMDKNMGSDPSLIFPSFDMSLYNDLYTSEINLIDSIGFDNYVLNLKNTGKISEQSRDLIVSIYNNPDILLSREFSNFPVSDYELDPFYDFIYKIALDLQTRKSMFEKTEIEIRSDCGWSHFIDTVLKGFTIGSKIGALIDKNKKKPKDGKKSGESTIVDFPFQVVGALWGAQMGIIFGILDWKSCDCGDLYNVSISPTPLCGKGTLLAVGETDEIDSYLWAIEQNGIINTYTTSVPRLVANQNSITVPLKVSVLGFCDNGEAGKAASGTINLYDGDVGDLIINYNCPEEEEDRGYGCFTTFNTSYITWYTTNHTSGKIIYSHTLTGGDVDFSTSNHIKVNWSSVGTYTLTVTATNVCSGETVTSELEIDVEI